ncbi:hypothetical protein WA158_007232 [Blastocystis sp. Blastoise]
MEDVLRSFYSSVIGEVIEESKETIGDEYEDTLNDLKSKWEQQLEEMGKISLKQEELVVTPLVNETKDSLEENELGDSITNMPFVLTNYLFSVRLPHQSSQNAPNTFDWNEDTLLIPQGDGIHDSNDSEENNNNLKKSIAKKHTIPTTSSLLKHFSTYNSRSSFGPPLKPVASKNLSNQSNKTNNNMNNSNKSLNNKYISQSKTINNENILSNNSVSSNNEIAIHQSIASITKNSISSPLSSFSPSSSINPILSSSLSSSLSSQTINYSSEHSNTLVSTSTPSSLSIVNDSKVPQSKIKSNTITSSLVPSISSLLKRHKIGSISKLHKENKKPIIDTGSSASSSSLHINTGSISKNIIDSINLVDKSISSKSNQSLISSTTAIQDNNNEYTVQSSQNIHNHLSKQSSLYSIQKNQEEANSSSSTTLKDFNTPSFVTSPIPSISSISNNDISSIDAIPNNNKSSISSIPNNNKSSIDAIPNNNKSSMTSNDNKSSMTLDLTENTLPPNKSLSNSTIQSSLLSNTNKDTSNTIATSDHASFSIQHSLSISSLLKKPKLKSNLKKIKPVSSIKPVINKNKELTTSKNDKNNKNDEFITESIHNNNTIISTNNTQTQSINAIKKIIDKNSEDTSSSIQSSLKPSLSPSLSSLTTKRSLFDSTNSSNNILSDSISINSFSLPSFPSSCLPPHSPPQSSSSSSFLPSQSPSSSSSFRLPSSSPIVQQNILSSSSSTKNSLFDINTNLPINEQLQVNKSNNITTLQENSNIDTSIHNSSGTNKQRKRRTPLLLSPSVPIPIVSLDTSTNNIQNSTISIQDNMNNSSSSTYSLLSSNNKESTQIDSSKTSSSSSSNLHDPFNISKNQIQTFSSNSLDSQVSSSLNIYDMNYSNSNIQYFIDTYISPPIPDYLLTEEDKEIIKNPNLLINEKQAILEQKYKLTTLFDSDIDNDDDKEEELFENVILSQYTKINRVKRKWKVSLVGVLIHLNDKDYILGTCHGELTF